MNSSVLFSFWFGPVNCRRNIEEREVSTCLPACCQVRLFEIPWTAAHQPPLSMAFPRQEYWSRLPFPPPRDLSKPEIKPTPHTLAGGFFTPEPPGKPDEHLGQFRNCQLRSWRHQQKAGDCAVWGRQVWSSMAILPNDIIPPEATEI